MRIIDIQELVQRALLQKDYDSVQVVLRDIERVLDSYVADTMPRIRDRRHNDSGFKRRKDDR